jgi:hypothetical protein
MQTSVQSLPDWAQLALLIIPAASAIFAAIGLLLSFYQLRRNNAQARLALMAESLRRFTGDEDIQRVFYAIEYSKFKYDEEFHGSQHERETDKLLRHFSNIALSWQGGLLSIRDLRPIQYYVLRVVQNDEVQKYLNFIASWSKQQKLGEHPYSVLIQLSKNLAK